MSSGLSGCRETIRIDDPGDPRVAQFVSIKERDLTGRQGRFVAEGTVVLRMLAAACNRGDAAADSILILENRLAGLEDILAGFKADVPVHVAPAAVFDAIAGFHMHRGVLAIGRRVRVPDLDGFLAGLEGRALVLALSGISNHDNMGAMFRNAAAFGVDAVLLDDLCCDPLYRKAIRVSVGAVLGVPFIQAGPLTGMIGRLRSAGFHLWGLSPRGHTDIADIAPSPLTALLMGPEGTGLPGDVMSSIDTARIRQRPGLDSLNVATATGIALHQVAMVNGII